MFTSKTNPILAEFRRFCGPDEWDIGSDRVWDYADSWVELIEYEDRNDRMVWGDLAGTNDRFFQHALKVLRRLAVKA